MDTKQKTREQISALADGELPDVQIDQALSAMQTADAKADWEIYHRIGDALRSDEVADVSFTEGFSARLAARLESEPVFIAPAKIQVEGRQSGVRRWALPGIAAAAAMAGVAFVATPHLMVALNGQESSTVGKSAVAEVRLTEAAVPAGAKEGGVEPVCKMAMQ